MNRRDLIKLGTGALLQAGAARILPAQAAQQMQMPSPSPQAAPPSPADFTLRIAPVTVELYPNHVISTIGYNGAVPGPLLRMREGKAVTVDVINETDVPEFVHWHGLFIPPEVDGAEEEGTPAVPPNGQRRYQFTPRPAGTRWYHTHAMAMGDLHRSTYTGQFGFLLIDSGNDPGHYDQEVFLALRDWEPFYSAMDENEAAEEGGIGAMPEKPATMDTRPNGLEVNASIFSINDKVLGAGEPIRVKAGDRVLVHLLNAGAIENRRLSLPGHQFHVLALDGNPAPSPGPTEVVELGPGERIDAIVEMNHPGCWILGSTDDPTRNAGLGIVVEYENQHHEPQWMPPSNPVWDYTIFGTAPPASRIAPEHVVDMVFEKIPSGSGQFNTWLVNGKVYPHEGEFAFQKGARHRIIFRNRSDDAHPLHFHRHVFELIDMNGKPTAGVIKDTVIVPMYGRATVDLMADQPGLTLFHCHIQQHMDYGFKALFRYS